MQDRPTTRELLEGVARFLGKEVVSALEGPMQFHVRVAANLLAIVRRELDAEPALREEHARLARLLGRDDVDPPGDRAVLEQAVGELARVLAERIRLGDADAEPFRTAVRTHLAWAVREKLRVANPRFSSGAS